MFFPDIRTFRPLGSVGVPFPLLLLVQGGLCNGRGLFFIAFPWEIYRGTVYTYVFFDRHPCAIFSVLCSSAFALKCVCFVLCFVVSFLAWNFPSLCCRIAIFFFIFLVFLVLIYRGGLQLQSASFFFFSWCVSNRNFLVV